LKIRRLNENIENKKYLDTPQNICPVCGEKDDITVWSSSINDNGIGSEFDCFYLDYKCNTCNFKWFAEYSYSHKSDNEYGDIIVPGRFIDKELYSPEKIEAKKYNL